MLGCLEGPPLSETGQKQSLRQNYGRLSENGQRLFLMSGVLRAIRFGRALPARGSAGLCTILGRRCFPCASQGPFWEESQTSWPCDTEIFYFPDPLPPKAGGTA